MFLNFIIYMLFFFYLLRVVMHEFELQCHLLTSPCMQAKALAEKNERDMQVQREQAERHVSTFYLSIAQFYFF